MNAQRLIPTTADRETHGFFEAAAQGRLVYRRCCDCGHAAHPPTAHCPHCGGWNTDWQEASGTGTLHSWTHVMHQVHQAYPAPYTIVVVELDDAPEVRLVGNLEGAPELQAGLKMAVWFETREGAVFPNWRVAAP